MISLIWAMDNKRLIGANNQMPWHFPADMKWFRENTLNKSILMGRKTFDSIGKALPKRQNIILSRQQGLVLDGCSVIHSLEDMLAQYENSEEELMVMGGAEVYAQCLPYAQRLYCTKIDHSFTGDAWFPEHDMSAWVQTYQACYAADEKNIYNYCFEIYARS